MTDAYAPRAEYWGFGIEQRPGNLNGLAISDEGSPRPIAARRHPVTSGPVTALFHGLVDHLCDEIERWPVVVGCMAWLTNASVLHSLATRCAVSILLQKEDFLRPDAAGWSKENLRRMYAALPGCGDRLELCSEPYNTLGDPRLPPLMCCGVVGRGVTPPRMHHKFMVFGEWEGGDPEWHEGRRFAPRSVWTGSLNATENGARSLENAVVVRDEVVADAYRREWETLLGLAEPLDWAHEWVAPLYRLGT